MIYTEKGIEDYICDNQDEFIEELKYMFDTDNEIEFIGRQVYIGSSNIADLVYEFDIKDKTAKITQKNFIIVELKYRNIEAKDLAQISRYVTTLQEKGNIYDKKNKKNIKTKVYGILLGFDLDENMKEINIFLDLIGNDRIKFITIKNDLIYNEPSYSHTDTYIENLKLDNKIMDVINE